MQITRSSIETMKGPADWFTGDVYIDTIASPSPPARVAAALVHFTPGARTAWHTHPLGQTIFVTEGVGALPARGRPGRGHPPRRPRVLRARREPLARRRPDRFMVHVAMQEADDSGSPVTWGEHVTDAEYGAAAPGS